MSEQSQKVGVRSGPELTRKQLAGEELSNAIRTKVEYYMSKENLQTDTYLVSKMTNDMWVDVSVIAQFRGMIMIGADEAKIVDAVKSLDSVLLSSDHKSIKPNIKVERKTLIIRDIPSDASEQEISEIFSHLEGDNAPVQIRKEVGDNLFVTFVDEERCLSAHTSLSTRQFRGNPVRGRVKSETLVKSYYQGTIPQQPFVYPTAYPGPMYVPERTGSFGRGGGRGMRPPRDTARDKNRGGKRKVAQTQTKRPGPSQQQQLHLGLQNFPPLPTESGSSERVGYGDEQFHKYEIKFILAVLEKMPRELLIAKPNFVTKEVVVLDEPAISPSSQNPLTVEESSSIFAQVDQTPLDRTSHSPFVSPLFVPVHSVDALPEMALPPAVTHNSYANAAATPGHTRSLRVPPKSVAPKAPTQPNTSVPAAVPKSPIAEKSPSSSSFKDILLAKKNPASNASAAREEQEKNDTSSTRDNDKSSSDVSKPLV